MTARAKLLTDDPDGIDDVEKKMIAAYPQAADMPNGEAFMAAVCDVTQEEIEARLACPELLARMEAAKIKAEASGKDITPLAQRIARKLLYRIDAQADDVDAFEAVELMKPINRILENAERVRLAEREKDEYANLPTFQFNFINGIQATLVPRPVPVETIEVDAISVTYNNDTRGEA